MKFWKRWIADIQSKTAALTILERGAYTELLDHYYSQNGPLPSDHSMLYRLCRAFEKPERDAIDKMLGMFFHKTAAGLYLNRRAQEEIERASRYSEEQAERSKLANEARWGKKPPKEKKTRVNGHASLSPEFTAFWSVYPRKVAKGDAEKAWASIKPDQTLATTITEAVRRQLNCEQWTKEGGQFIPHPATWLNRKGWEDQPEIQINFGRCKYCSQPAISKKNGIPHCPNHIDFAKQGA